MKVLLSTELTRKLRGTRLLERKQCKGRPQDESKMQLKIFTLIGILSLASMHSYSTYFTAFGLQLDLNLLAYITDRMTSSAKDVFQINK